MVNIPISIGLACAVVANSAGRSVGKSGMRGTADVVVGCCKNGQRTDDGFCPVLTIGLPADRATSTEVKRIENTKAVIRMNRSIIVWNSLKQKKAQGMSLRTY